MTTMILRVVRAIVLALLLALLLAVIGAVVAPEGQENVLFAVFFSVGLIGFCILFLKAQRVGFWFCLSYAVEWALLPIAALINTRQVEESPGCSALFGAIAATVFLAITVPVGAVGFVVFVLLALLVFRKKTPPTTSPPEPGQP